MKKYLVIAMILFSGCASFNSKAGAIPNSLVYEHRIPHQDTKVTQVVPDDKGVIRQAIPWGEISSNAPAIGNSVANIVGAVKGNFGFPYAIIPELLSTGLKSTQKFKEETSEQEVIKFYYVAGMKDLSATLPDKTSFKFNVDTTITKAADK